jgi:hypothetical protein
MVPDGTYTTEAFTKVFTTKEVVYGPQVEEILFSKSGNDILAYFYFANGSGVAKFVMSHLVNDDTVYNMSDSELLAYLEESHDTTYVANVSNQTYFNVVDKNIAVGDTIYYAGAVYDAQGAYTVIRTTYVR